jgi:hypothetical protein
MAFGLNTPKSGDYVDIVKYDARAGRMFRIDYDPDTQTKEAVDITSPAPRFAIDFGTLEIGYVKFTSNGPDYRMVPEGQKLPEQPDEKNEKRQLTYRPGCKLLLYGKCLGGLRLWTPTANCVLEPLDELYQKYRAAPEAKDGKIPVVEITRTVPITTGQGQRKSTVYAPFFAILGWVDRVSEMGDRTVAIPGAATLPPPASAAAIPRPHEAGDDLNDDIPF